MDQIKIGKFIANCRKEKKLTQAQLAQSLNITDRAISKWENGKGLPDSSIMLELCNILEINVNELLSGERIDKKDYNKKANENLIEMKRKEEKNIINNTVISVIFSLTLLISIVVCGICDLAISGKFTWSLLANSSIIFSWLILFPLIQFGKKGICYSLISLSVLIIPFLYVLSILIPEEELILPIGIRISIISLVYVWIIYALFKIFKTRKFIIAGITIILIIPLNLVINIILSKIIFEPLVDEWDIVSSFTTIIIAGILFAIDYSKNKNLKEK